MDKVFLKKTQVFLNGYKCPNSSTGKVSSIAPITKYNYKNKARPCSKPIIRGKGCTLPVPKLTKSTLHHNLIKIPVSNKIPPHSTASDKTWGARHTVVAWYCWLRGHFG